MNNKVIKGYQLFRMSLIRDKPNDIDGNIRY